LSDTKLILHGTILCAQINKKKYNLFLSRPYGQQDIHICYGDALNNTHDAFPDICDGNFDLLVSNPPYSVRGFLETLPEEERKAYSLTGTINDAATANSIETFFVERAKQLLKAGGVAAIILPSSILSNGGATYIRAREILLQYFDIVAVAEFGSGTFGKTGTNTATLFLRRKQTTPDTAEHYRGRVEEWFKGCGNNKRKQVIYKDEYLIEQYCAHVNVPLSDYRTLLKGDIDGLWSQQEHFKPYADKFFKSTEVVNLRKQKKFKALTKDEQHAEISKRYLAFVQTIERDKLYHFVMASDQPNPVLVLRSPSVSKEIKQFLGYEWSSSKGDEGIKLIEDVKGQHITLLYDGPDRLNPALFNRGNSLKANHYIAANFDGNLGAIPNELTAFFTTARLVDMLDFSRLTFEKQITLVPKKSLEIMSKWPLCEIGSFAETSSGGTPSSREPKYYENGTVFWINSGEVKRGRIFDSKNTITDLGLRNSSAKVFPKKTVLIAMYGATAGQVGILEVEASTNQAVCGVLPNKKYLSEYLYFYLSTRIDQFLKLRSGRARLNLSQEKIKNVIVPFPPLDIQKKIVSECEAVDIEVSAASEVISEAQTDMETEANAINASANPRIEIDKLSLSIQYGLSQKMNEGGIGYKIFRMNEIVQGRMVDNGLMKYADITPDEFIKYKLNHGDLLFNRTNSIEHVGKTGLFDLEGEYCFASYLVRVVPDTSKILPLFLAKMMNSAAFQAEAKGKASKSINQSNINATVMRNIKVPVPTLAEQKVFVTSVEALEQQIAAAQATIAAVPAKKEAVLKRYL